MYHKSIIYRRGARLHHISKRTSIGVNCMHWEGLSADKRKQGMLSKGKIHCSCPLCSCKSTKFKGISTNSLINYSASDKRKFASLADSINEYNAESYSIG